MFDSVRELLPRSLIWVHQHRRYSHPFRIILTPSAKELTITFRPGIRIAYVSTIRNRHSEMVDRTLVSRNSVLGPKFHRGAYVVIHRLSYPFGKTWIFVRAVIRTARESPIWNRHFDPVGTRSDSEISSLAPKFLPGAWSRAADAIAYGHPFAQTGITFRSVIVIAYKTPIRNRHSETLVVPLLPQAIRCHFSVKKTSFLTPKLRFRITISSF
ncbi:hypothetical protein Taro_018418 [Colocasia esculenta]|uniref:Uncharacterized protein n=1 Tax=Colocasia esculenta TaxID=4460 RepID=A0A843UW82_COLES|nr:hypothetical protein [Colocasia esculenta]